MKQKSLASFFSASGAKKPPAPAKTSLGPIAKDLQKARTITDVDQNTETKAGVSQNKKRKLKAVRDSDSESFGKNNAGKDGSEYDLSELADAMEDSEYGGEAPQINSSSNNKRKTAPL